MSTLRTAYSFGGMTIEQASLDGSAKRAERWDDSDPTPYAVRVVIACEDAPHRIEMSDRTAVEIPAHIHPDVVRAMAAAIAR